MILTQDTNGVDLPRGEYDLQISVTTGSISIERSIDKGTSWVEMTGGSWTSSATGTMKVRNARYRAIASGTATIDLERI